MPFRQKSWLLSLLAKQGKSMMFVAMMALVSLGGVILCLHNNTKNNNNNITYDDVDRRQQHQHHHHPAITNDDGDDDNDDALAVLVGEDELNYVAAIDSLPPLVEVEPPPLKRREYEQIVQHVEEESARVKFLMYPHHKMKKYLRPLDEIPKYPAPFQCPDESSLPSDANADADASKSIVIQQVVPNDRLDRLYKQDDWEHTGNWGTSQIDFEYMVHQLVQQLPPEASFHDGDEVFESACGAGRFISSLRGAVEVEVEVEEETSSSLSRSSNNLQLRFFGSDLLWEAGVNYIRYLVPEGTFCLSDSLDLSWVPANRFPWVFTGYIEPLKPELGDHNMLHRERWYRWWTYNMARIAKPGGWIVIAFNRRPETGGVQPEFWRQAKQLRLWRVKPESVKIVKTNDEYPRRNHINNRYHIIMQRNTHPFPSTPCAHVKDLAETDLDYAKCRLTDYEQWETFHNKQVEKR